MGDVREIALAENCGRERQAGPQNDEHECKRGAPSAGELVGLLNAFWRVIARGSDASHGILHQWDLLHADKVIVFGVHQRPHQDNETGEADGHQIPREHHIVLQHPIKDLSETMMGQWGCIAPGGQGMQAGSLMDGNAESFGAVFGHMEG